MRDAAARDVRRVRRGGGGEGGERWVIFRRAGRRGEATYGRSGSRSSRRRFDLVEASRGDASRGWHTGRFHRGDGSCAVGVWPARVVQRARVPRSRARSRLGARE